MLCVIFLRKNGSGYILGDFFSNPSGRPACGHFQPHQQLEMHKNFLPFLIAHAPKVDDEA
jgi:hypothetical protein